MDIGIVVDTVLVVIFVVVTAAYLKFGGKEYTYDEKGKLVPYKEQEPAGVEMAGMGTTGV